MQWFLQFDGCCGFNVYCTDGKFWWQVMAWSDDSITRTPVDAPKIEDGRPELIALHDVPWDLDNDFTSEDE